MLAESSSRLKRVEAPAGRVSPAGVIANEIDHGRGILGVIDGVKTRGIETDADIKWRKEFLRKIGYKL